MPLFVTVWVCSACITAVGSGLFLLALSYFGTGFGFGDVRKDLLKIAIVSAPVGVVDALWSFVPMRHWSFHVLAVIVHGILLRLFFLEGLCNKEAFLVAFVSRVLWLLISFSIYALMWRNLLPA